MSQMVRSGTSPLRRAETLDGDLETMRRRIDRSRSVQGFGSGILGVGGFLGLFSILVIPTFLLSYVFLVACAICCFGVVLSVGGGWRARVLDERPAHKELVELNNTRVVPRYRVRVSSGRHATRLTLQRVGPASSPRGVTVLKERSWEVGKEDEAEAMELAMEWRAQAEMLNLEAREAHLEARAASEVAVDFARELAGLAGDERWQAPRVMPMPPTAE